MRTALAFVLICFSGHAATLLRVACGGPGGTDQAGNVWSADSGFSGGYQWTAANQPALGSQPVPYNALRASSGFPFTYSFTLQPNSTYTVTLKFIEPNKTAAGQRIFGVSLNSTVNFSSIDLFATTGLLKPLDLMPFVVSTGSDGKITITLTPATGNAVLSGIQIDGPAPAVPVMFQSDTEANKPASCPAAPTLFRATDSHFLYWCAPGEAGWKHIWDGIGQTLTVVGRLLQDGVCSPFGPQFHPDGTPLTMDSNGKILTSGKILTDSPDANCLLAASSAK